MKRTRLHSKVLIIWNRWMAIQVVFAPEISLGIAFHWCRPMLDIYLGPLTIAFGRTAYLTELHDALRSRCRGFVIRGYPEETLL